jgi:hypothetical protein
MIHPASLVMLILLVASAHAGPTCTTAPVDTWLPQETMRRRIETDGHRIVVLATTPGNGHEIHGRDETGRRVEIHLDPVSGTPMKANVR